ncbi:MAG: quinolinate synthase NadA [Candidatus Hermodarchaeota archaeon]|nr:quinolinate synthase NadA [Candidatus Hermodarchaeota archaeon]
MNSLQQEIRQIAQNRNAVILAHNYQPGEIQEIADYVGDSFGLCQQAQQIDAERILFCGVRFMAETAAILNPDKLVLIPDERAYCPMAAQLPVKVIREAKLKHPNVPVVLYINTTAEAKAEADVICTSANLCTILEKLDTNPVIFGPDANMADYARHVCGYEVIPIPDNGFCHVHITFSFDSHFLQLQKEYPEAKLLVHPECSWELQSRADLIGSTGQMLQYARNSSAEMFIIATEVDLVTRLRRELPNKIFIPALDYAVCKAMKKTTLAKVKESLVKDQFQVIVPERIANRARRAIQRMLELTSGDD